MSKCDVCYNEYHETSNTVACCNCCGQDGQDYFEPCSEGIASKLYFATHSGTNSDYQERIDELAKELDFINKDSQLYKTLIALFIKDDKEEKEVKAVEALRQIEQEQESESKQDGYPISRDQCIKCSFLEYSGGQYKCKFNKVCLLSKADKEAEPKQVTYPIDKEHCSGCNFLEYIDGQYKCKENKLCIMPMAYLSD